MSYFSPPTERPRHVKRFLTAREVEDLAAAGEKQIVHAVDMVITDAAREVAHDLGLRIVPPDESAARQRGAPPAFAEPSRVAPAMMPGARPSSSHAALVSAFRQQEVARPASGPAGAVTAPDARVSSLVNAIRASGVVRA